MGNRHADFAGAKIRPLPRVRCERNEREWLGWWRGLALSLLLPLWEKVGMRGECLKTVPCFAPLTLALSRGGEREFSDRLRSFTGYDLNHATRIRLIHRPSVS
jgi:hypothetical protein